MSKYLLNKFLYTIDRDPELVERYREDPRGTVTWWEDERANVILNSPRWRRVLASSPMTEREALATHDYVKLFELGAHHFLTLTLLSRSSSGTTRSRWPSSANTAPGSALALPYPDITT